VYFEPLHDTRPLFERALKPDKRLLVVTKSQVSVQECGRRNVTRFSPPVKLVENPQRFSAAGRAGSVAQRFSDGGSTPPASTILLTRVFARVRGRSYSALNTRASHHAQKSFAHNQLITEQ
jgi:hypothetical protein